LALNLKTIIMSDVLDETAVEAKRPTFLTVLCILTFIGSGWGILSSLAFQDETISEYAGYYYWVVLLLNVGTLYGAIQMWKMQKMGLYIWTIAELLAVVLMWVVVKGAIAAIVGAATDDIEAAGGTVVTGANDLVQAAMNMVLILGTIFPAVFVLLYWLNAKHLK
jgi:hypothetical protein